MNYRHAFHAGNFADVMKHALLVRLLAVPHIQDTQCGFKAFERRAFLPVFKQQRLEGFAFDVEILFLARRMGLRVLETPTLWSHCTDSKVNFLGDALRMLQEIFRIRQNTCKKLYTFTPADPLPLTAAAADKTGEAKPGRKARKKR
jgi:hypothetical protein